jgi:hypothetical protein
MGAGIALEQRGDPAGAAESYRRATELLQTAYEESGAPEELFGKAEALTRIIHERLRKLPIERAISLVLDAPRLDVDGSS